MASFQRMIQEPKSKQTQLPQVYKLAVLNHSLLSSLASLGTYIQSHKTTTASEAFNIVQKPGGEFEYTLIDGFTDAISDFDKEKDSDNNVIYLG